MSLVLLLLNHYDSLNILNLKPFFVTLEYFALYKAFVHIVILLLL